jgi:intein-encoded DNA endonuclease-like protein
LLAVNTYAEPISYGGWNSNISYTKSVNKKWRLELRVEIVKKFLEKVIGNTTQTQNLYPKSLKQFSFFCPFQTSAELA